jgi:ferredoxin
LGETEMHDPAAVAGVVGAPDFMLPWLDRFYDDEDADLVLAVARSGSVGETRATGDVAAALAGAYPGQLDRAVRRGVLDRDDAGAYSPTSFHDRLEIWAMFEGWKDVPVEIHRRLADWDVDYYAESIRESVEAVRTGGSGGSKEAVYTYLLLHEAEEVIAARKHVYLWPCDCRSIVSSCRRPVYACLRFDNDRGLGWEISRERAVQILRETDDAGLMHTDYLSRRPGDPHAICNCCTDCCYPHLATERLGTNDVWPVRRHHAVVDREECTGCDACVSRCPFGAITMQDEVAVVEAAECRGCGLCSTGCPSEAIAMRPRTATSPAVPA